MSDTTKDEDMRDNPAFQADLKLRTGGEGDAFDKFSSQAGATFIAGHLAVARDLGFSSSGALANTVQSICVMTAGLLSLSLDDEVAILEMATEMRNQIVDMAAQGQTRRAEAKTDE